MNDGDDFLPDVGDEPFHEREIDYESKVGHGVPPSDTRWQKGFCPNPLGRPPKNTSRKHLLEKVAYRLVEINASGILREVPTIEAIILIIKIKAIEGNAQAVRLVDRLLGIAHEEDEPRPRGILLTHGRMTEEEWNEVYGPSEGSGEAANSPQKTIESDPPG